MACALLHSVNDPIQSSPVSKIQIPVCKIGLPHVKSREEILNLKINDKMASCANRLRFVLNFRKSLSVGSLSDIRWCSSTNVEATSTSVSPLVLEPAVQQPSNISAGKSFSFVTRPIFFVCQTISSFYSSLVIFLNSPLI